MKPILSPEIHEVINAVHYRPALSIILPLEARISLRAEMTHTLKIAADKAERELLKYYPDEQCRVVMQKLKGLIANPNFPDEKKGMVIYVSPIFEKVLYLDSPVIEKITVDDSFEVRDLIYDAKRSKKFLLLVLSGQQSKVFLGNTAWLTALASPIPESVFAGENDADEGETNLSDINESRQVATVKFLHQIDEGLDNLLHEYQLPVLVLGSERIIGHFKKFSKHTAATMDYVAGNYEEATIGELMDLIAPYLDTRQVNLQKEWLNQLETAANHHLLCTGIQNVWREVSDGKGGLLVVEKNYRYTAQHGATPDLIEPITEPYNHFSYIRDAVDDCIEMVLKNGGDVEFTADGALEQFEHIALSKFY
ncbi:baeRF3 domain-containing protein [Mucilaginibacter xinganensis]|uniref:Uncharacterized protein n=1 Tax=Mucilaginibacter xinganensis TaxID=1234841 RepID=A0A223NUT1_9SPHI|nr:hypothetical protein [Mucilaginibacter xinganensis]ASU33596.1 hypothetical protein MuYL_1700 [Mucilaginibacter xinganensis]